MRVPVLQAALKPSLVVCLLLCTNIGAHVLQLKAHRRDGVAASPAVLTGAVALPATKLASEGNRTFPCEATDDRRRCMLGRHLETPMHGIRHHVAFQDATLLLPGPCVKDGPEGFANVATQRFPSSLRDDDNVIRAMPPGMRRALRGV